MIEELFPSDDNTEEIAHTANDLASDGSFILFPDVKDCDRHERYKIWEDKKRFERDLEKLAKHDPSVVMWLATLEEEI